MDDGLWDRQAIRAILQPSTGGIKGGIRLRAVINTETSKWREKQGICRTSPTYWARKSMYSIMTGPNDLIRD